MSTQKDSLRERVRKWVVQHGPVPIARVVSALARFIPTPQATAAGRAELAYGVRRRLRTAKRAGKNPANPIYTPAHLAGMGRRSMVQDALRRLAKQGKLARVSRGVYGPPAPKLYVPAESA